MTCSLTIKTFDVPARRLNIPLPIQPPEGGWTWPPTTVAMIAGEREAILVDSLPTLEDCRNLGLWIKSTGRSLKAIYITHGHLDHFIGVPTLLEQFPGTPVVATEETIELIMAESESGTERATYSPYFVDEIGQEVVIPRAVSDVELELEGHEIRAVAVGQSDVAHSSYIHIPDLRAVIVGDIAYNDVHPTLVGSDQGTREAWIETISDIQRLNPEVVVASHRAKGSKNDDQALSGTIEYLEDASRFLSKGPTITEFVEQMMAAHPTRQNASTLYFGAFDLLQH